MNSILRNKSMLSLGYSLFVMSFLTFSIHPASAEELEDKLKTANQEPKGSGMQLVSFRPTILFLPFELQYPESWYVREEFGGIGGLFISRELIRNRSDQYKVGMTIYYYPYYFARPADSNSPMAKTSESVIEVRKWEPTKQKFGKNALKEGSHLISETDAIVAGQPAQRTEWQSDAVRVISYCVKAENHLMLITFEAPPSEFETYQPIFQQIEGSLRFTR